VPRALAELNRQKRTGTGDDNFCDQVLSLLFCPVFNKLLDEDGTDLRGCYYSRMFQGKFDFVLDAVLGVLSPEVFTATVV
jgi:hypothetical protein